MPVCPRLLPELLDQVVDSLCDSRDALKNCCLISKPWIPHARKHLFAKIQFRTTKDLELWKATFPDPSTSPAHYTKVLFIGVVTAAGIGEGCWVLAFSRVVHLKMDIPAPGFFEQTSIFLVPFHGFSPVLRSLCVESTALIPSQIFDLLRSFPLLEDISMTVHYRGLIKNSDYSFENQSTAIQSSRSPALDGSLQLFSESGMDPFVSRLLSLPNGLYSRNVDLVWHHVADVQSSTAELVEGCCSTLESLNIDGSVICTSVQHPCQHR